MSTAQQPHNVIRNAKPNACDDKPNRPARKLPDTVARRENAQLGLQSSYMRARFGFGVPHATCFLMITHCSLVVTPFFRWYDLWIGAYVDVDNRTIYICPLPMLGLKIRMRWSGERVVPKC